MLKLFNMPTGTIIYRLGTEIIVFLPSTLLNFDIKVFTTYKIESETPLINTVYNIDIKDLSSHNDWIINKSNLNFYQMIVSNSFADSNYRKYDNINTEDWFLFFVCDENEALKIKLLSEDYIDTGLEIDV